MASRPIEKFALRQRADTKARNGKELARFHGGLIRDYLSNGSAVVGDVDHEEVDHGDVVTGDAICEERGVG